MGKYTDLTKDNEGMTISSRKKRRINLNKLINHHINNVINHQCSTGLLLACTNKKSWYRGKCWIRDTVYEALALEVVDDKQRLEKAYEGLFNILKKHEDKINRAIRKKPDAAFNYIHARFNPTNFEEYLEPWGNKQNDAIGALLFKILDLEEKGYKVIKGGYEARLVQKLCHYLQSVEYWHDKDSGMWEEEYEEAHSSSIGACTAALIKAQKHGYNVENWLIKKGKKRLQQQLPRESHSKHVDLTLLSLIYPYNIVTDYRKKQILENVESELLREKGVLRYLGDKYYSHTDQCGKLISAEWAFGLSWLSVIYSDIDKDKSLHFFKKAYATITPKGFIPELYYGKTDKPNDNTPLGWSEAMFVVAADRMKKLFGNKLKL